MSNMLILRTTKRQIWPSLTNQKIIYSIFFPFALFAFELFCNRPFFAFGYIVTILNSYDVIFGQFALVRSELLDPLFVSENITFLNGCRTSFDRGQEVLLRHRLLDVVLAQLPDLVRALVLDHPPHRHLQQQITISILMFQKARPFW